MARRGGHSGGGNSERWLLTYSDLITLLLAFFVVMYSMSNADLEKFRQLSASMRQAFSPSTLTSSPSQPTTDGPSTEVPGGALSEDFAFVKAEMENFALENGLEGSITVELRPEGMAIVLSDNAIFASGRAELGERSYPILDKVAELLATMPNEVRVEGHTDDLPADSAGYPTNWDLSAGRAVSVVRYLTELAGLDPHRLMAAACSEYRPIAVNDTPQGRGRNRRAEILIIYPAAAG
ncbi:MAG: flagellar motor protein MotB [Chloroflexota bacterium]